MKMFLLFLLLVASRAAAQQEPPPGCSQPAFREFDFWVGEWEVSWPASETSGGKPGRGMNRIVIDYDGCVVLERFEGAPAMRLRGTSVSTFGLRDKKWRQTWVDNYGSYLDFSGEFKDGQMVLVRQAIGAEDKPFLQRMVWKNIKPDSLDWSWERSDDGGKNWKVLWPIRYQRKAQGAMEGAGMALDWKRRLLDTKTALTKANYGGDLDELKRTIADFDHLAQNDSMGWLANYYAGHGSFVLALMVGPLGLLSPQGDPQQMQRHVDEAIQHLEASVKKKQDFADAWALLAACYSMKVRFDPRQYGLRLQKALSSALALEPRNPRVVLFDAMVTFRAPPQAGGDREKGLVRWQEAISFFSQETNRDSTLPDWGYAEAWAWYAGANLSLQPPNAVRAKEAVDKALGIRPDFLWIRKSLLPRIQAQLGRTP